MRKLKIAIFDDEQIWIELIKKTTEEILVKKKIGADIYAYSNMEDFTGDFSHYDIALVDIMFHNTCGLDICETYVNKKENGIPIIVTGYDYFAKEGYKVSAFRFVSKDKLVPELEEALFAAVQKIEKNIAIELNVIGIGMIIIYLSNIIYLQRHKRHIEVCTTYGRYECDGTIEDYYERLKKYGFEKVSRAEIVSFKEIKLITNDFIIMSNDEKIYQSKRKSREIRQKWFQWICDEKKHL